MFGGKGGNYKNRNYSDSVSRGVSSSISIPRNQKSVERYGSRNTDIIGDGAVTGAVLAYTATGGDVTSGILGGMLGSIMDD